MKTKRVAVYFWIPADTDPSELLEDVEEFVYENYGLDEYLSDVAVIDPAPKK